MEYTIACVERELKMLEDNYAVTEQQITRGEATPYLDVEEQQALREVQIEGLREGLDYLRY